MDQNIKDAQKWLNNTYGAVAGWVPLDEDGLTGWSTIYGLRRALQAELGISPLTSGFGTATTAAFVGQVGRIDADIQPPQMLRILSGALWCKGCPGAPGLWSGAAVVFDNLVGSIATIREQLGLGIGDPHVDVKLMASLLSMDAYTRLRSGSDEVRDVQQWLNANYSGRADFPLVPCDGVLSRQVQSALMFGIQYEIGMPDGTANGNFGPGTRSGLRAKADIGPGAVDGARRFVHLFQAALRFNALSTPCSGVFGSATSESTRQFQGFMELPVTGRGDYSTWCALLVSSGDTTIATTCFDTNKQLTAAEAQGAVAAGYTTVGRYTVGSAKFITAPELEGLRIAGLRLLPIHQRYNNAPELMTYANGQLHGVEATERCRVLGLPTNSIIFFSVDFDALGETINGPVCDYFRGVNDAMGLGLTTRYRVGVYGTRNVCTTVMDEGHAEGAFVAGMSTGFSGNLGFPMPKKWQYNQISEIQVQLGGSTRTIGIDKDVLSSAARPVDLSAVMPPPVEIDGSTTLTGFDAFFEWLVRAEVACERGLAEASSWLKDYKPFASFIATYVAHWLQKPDYWGFPLWSVYTPIVHAGDEETLAQAAAESALEALSPNKPASRRDIAHFAATLRGYDVWGVPASTSDYGLGDLGGWALDLLQVWGSYGRARKIDSTLDLADYLVGQIGAVGATGGFDHDDVVADADAFLVAQAMKALDGGSLLSTALRGLLKRSSAERVALFYDRRFGSSQDNVAQAFARLVDGIDVGSIPNLPFSKNVLLRAAFADVLPDPSQARICAHAYARRMATHAQG